MSNVILVFIAISIHHHKSAANCNIYTHTVLASSKHTQPHIYITTYFFLLLLLLLLSSLNMIMIFLAQLSSLRSFFVHTACTAPAKQVNKHSLPVPAVRWLPADCLGQAAALSFTSLGLPSQLATILSCLQHLPILPHPLQGSSILKRKLSEAMPLSLEPLTVV